LHRSGDLFTRSFPGGIWMSLASGFFCGRLLFDRQTGARLE
jgi:hypothetical protein